MTRSVPHARHHGLLSLFVFIWGGNFVLAEVALREMAPISFSVSRFVMGGAALAALLYAEYRWSSTVLGTRNRLFPELTRGDWGRLLLVSVIGGTLAPWLGIEGLELTHGARASLWLALGPALSSALGYLWNTEEIGRFGMVGIVLAGVGTFALAGDGLRPEQGYWAGDLLLFVALLLTVAELHLIQPLVRRHGSTPMIAARTVIGGIIYLFVASPALVQEPWLALTAWTWVAILLGGGIGVGMGQWIRVRALHALGPTRVIVYGNLVPLATLLLAWLTIGTQPSVLELVSGVLIVAGTFALQVMDAPEREAARRSEGAEAGEAAGKERVADSDVSIGGETGW